MTVDDQASAILEIAGKRARDEARMLKRLVENMRLASFRSYLAATVNSMSAPVPGIIDLAGSTVGDALQRLRPGHRWPAVTSRTSGYPQIDTAMLGVAKAGGRCPWRPEPLIADSIVSEDALGLFTEAKVHGRSLEIKVRGDGFVFLTHHGTGFVMIENELPDTVVAACHGRRLSDVIEHRVFGQCDAAIAQAVQIAGGTSLMLDVGRLPLEVPWRS